MNSIDNYLPLVGEKVIGEIYKKARRLLNKHIVHINSTAYGGGVAEILNSLIILLNDIGVDAGWRVLSGPSDFFTVTKKFHNALQGNSINLSNHKKKLYLDTNERFSRFTHLDHDCVIIHDPQPLPLIRYKKKIQPWIWRCHIDLTEPNREVWDFIKTFILRYDLMIISSERYKKKDIPIDQKIIHPSIDPFSPKNMDLSGETMVKILKKFSIPTDKPLLTQVSRLDQHKDPEGVLKVFQLVKEKIDCRLLYCYNMAPDDPEGINVYNKMKRLTKNGYDRGDVLFVLGDNQILVNVLQRVSAVILQKSLKEGFGLTVSEAMWKETPVVASYVGGIPSQIIDGETGFLVEPNDISICADRVIALLKDKEMALEMGRKAKKHVKKNFLITRHLDDYLSFLIEVFNSV